MNLTKEHLEVIDYLEETIQRKDMGLYNRYFTLGVNKGIKYLERVLSCCPWREGMPDLTGKVLGFSNGTSAYVIAQFKCGSDIFLQVANPNEGELLKYDYYGYTKDKDMVILTVEDPEANTKNTTNSIQVSSIYFPLTDFGYQEPIK